MISEYISAVPAVARFNDLADFRVREIGMDRKAHFAATNLAGSRDISEYLASSISQGRLVGRRDWVVNCAGYALRLEPVHETIAFGWVDQNRKQVPGR